MLTCELVCALDRFLCLDREFVPPDSHIFFSCSNNCRSNGNFLLACTFAKKNGRWSPSPVRVDSRWKNCELAALLALEGLLPIADLDLFRFGFRPLGQGDLQDALLIAGLHLVSIHGVRELEGADKGAIPAFDAMEVLFLLFLFELALALDRQGAVLHA